MNHIVKNTNHKSPFLLIWQSPILLSVVLLCLTLNGCEWFAEAVIQKLVKDKIEGDIPIPDGSEFAGCMAGKPELVGASTTIQPASVNPSGKLRIPQNLRLAMQQRINEPDRVVPASGIEDADVGDNATHAVAVMDSPVFAALTSLYEKSMNPRVGPAAAASRTTPTGKLSFSQEDFYIFIDQAGKAAATNSWEDLATISRKYVTTSSAASVNDKADASKVGDFADLLAGYMKAYFRAGQFAQLNLNGAKFSKAIQETLHLSDQQSADQIVMAFFPHLFPIDSSTNQIQDQNIRLFGSIGSVGFVSRGGQTLQFPALQATLDISSARPLTLPKLDYSSVASEIIRVLAEAVGDSLFGVPGVSNSTAVQLNAIPEFKGEFKAAKSVTTTRFASIESISRGVDAGVTTVVGKIIRGAGPVALNNEALASAIEALIGATAKKTSEKVTWCFYASLSQEEAQPSATVKPAAALESEAKRKFTTVSLSIPSPRPYVATK